MSREIDLLAAEARRGRLIVEKDSNRLWEPGDLREAAAACLYENEDRLVAVDEVTAVTSPFPGCLQQPGGVEDWSRCRAIGQTRHFVVFERT